MVETDTRLPLFVEVTVETTGTMLMGSEINAALTALEPLGVDMIGLNCATGPQEMSEHLRQLAGEAAVQRGYVYYSEVPPIASVDLESIDRLWVMYSQGRFGFSVQIRLLRSLNGRWDQLWPRLGWKQGGVWTRYPRSFTWSLEAPEGHLPLVNQLRGVRLMDALLSHPGLQQRVSA